MRLIDADKLKKRVLDEGKIIIDEHILECDNVHEILVYLLEKVEDMVREKIDAAPTVEPVRGEWINTDFGILCTACRRTWDYFEINPEEVMAFKRCPECGADMRGEKND